VTPVLEAREVSAGYAGQALVHDLSISVEEGQVVCLLGANGAGKTTTLLSLCGILPLLKGAVYLEGKQVKSPLHVRARRGLAYVSEERSVFGGLSARDNLRVAGVSTQDAVALFPELEKRLSVRGGLLSGGEQQMLTLARALSRRPKLLLADELSLGLAPVIVDRLLIAVRKAADSHGLGVLMVEQHMRKAMKFADRVVVMRRGRLVLDLPGSQARLRSSDVERAYLARDDETEGDSADPAEATAEVENGS
jgi:branched-chain amino acid transport system ATP-binding protein